MAAALAYAPNPTTSPPTISSRATSTTWPCSRSPSPWCAPTSRTSLRGVTPCELDPPGDLAAFSPPGPAQPRGFSSSGRALPGRHRSGDTRSEACDFSGRWRWADDDPWAMLHHSVPASSAASSQTPVWTKAWIRCRRRGGRPSTRRSLTGWRRRAQEDRARGEDPAGSHRLRRAPVGRSRHVTEVTGAVLVTQEETGVEGELAEAVVLIVPAAQPAVQARAALVLGVLRVETHEGSGRSVGHGPETGSAVLLSRLIVQPSGTSTSLTEARPRTIRRMVETGRRSRCRRTADRRRCRGGRRAGCHTDVDHVEEAVKAAVTLPTVDGLARLAVRAGQEPTPACARPAPEETFWALDKHVCPPGPPR